MRGILQRHQRADRGNEYVPFLDGRGRPEVQDARFPVKIPFARRVELLQQVQSVVALAGSVPVGAVRLLRVDDFVLCVDSRDLHVGVRPIPRPVPVQPQVFRVDPTCRAVAFVSEMVGEMLVRFLCDGHPPLIGPAGKRHGLILEEQLEPGLATATEPPGGEFAEIRYPLRAEIGLQHLPARGFIEAFEYPRVFDDRKTGHYHAADNAHVFVFIGAIGHRGRFRGRILGAEFEGSSKAVLPASDEHAEAPLRSLALRFRRANRVTRVLERRERLVQRARIRISAVHGHIEGALLLRSGRENRTAGHQ